MAANRLDIDAMWMRATSMATPAARSSEGASCHCSAMRTNRVLSLVTGQIEQGRAQVGGDCGQSTDLG